MISVLDQLLKSPECQNISEDTQDMPQSGRTAFLEIGNKQPQIYVAYEATDARTVRLKPLLARNLTLKSYAAPNYKTYVLSA